ncbi:hypothetical protein L9F63_002371, partial [Diploptera punctata]
MAVVSAIHGHEEHHAHPKYEFKYGVHDGHTHDIKEQAEKRDGDKVEGYYKLVEPDGTTRTVHYTADKHNGFNAKVERSGHAKDEPLLPMCNCSTFLCGMKTSKVRSSLICIYLATITITVAVVLAILALTVALPVYEEHKFRHRRVVVKAISISGYPGLSSMGVYRMVVRILNLIIFALMPVVLTLPIFEHHSDYEVEHHAHPKYEFKYGVHDGHTHDIKEQAEKRDGDKVEGYYKLVEPDGTTRTVHYTADKHNGFNAKVERSGHAAHPIVHHNI